MKSLSLAASILIILSQFFGCKAVGNIEENSTRIYVGTYTQKEGHVDGKGDGIYLITLNHNKKSISIIDTIDGLINPSYIDINQEGELIVAVNEVGRDASSGWLSLIDKNSGYVSDTIETEGLAPCHVEFSKDNKIWFANYMGKVGYVTYRGNFFEEMHTIELAADITSDHPRQEASHPHSTIDSGVEGVRYVADLGNDRIWIIDLKSWDKEGDQYVPAFIKLRDGSGPRHMQVDLKSSRLFILNELSNTMSIASIDKSSGALTLLNQKYPLISDKFADNTTSADIKISNEGGSIYTTNRGGDVVSHFMIDENKVKLDSSYSTVGSTPRNLMITSDDKYVIVANQDSSGLSVFSRDEGGRLSFLYKVDLPTPVCLKEDI